MNYYKCELTREGIEFVYPFDVEKGIDFIYSNDYLTTYFKSEETIANVEEVTEEEYNSFLDSLKVEYTPIEEKPSEIEELRSQVLLLEETLMFILSGGE